MINQALLKTYAQIILDNYVSYQTKDVDLFQDPFYLVNLGVPFKNYLETPNRLAWDKDILKRFVEFYVNY